MSKLVTIYGGSGFVGRYIARRMAKEGWRVRVAVRRPNEAMHVKPYGVPGQVEPVFCNVRDDMSVAAVMQGADAVVNCVGVLNELGKNTFGAVHAEGAGRIARIAAQEGVASLVQISAIGADADADSVYSRTKAAGEAAVLQHFPGAVILRPSVIFGAEDEFFNRFAGMTRLSPVLPIASGSTRFQPVYVDDVAKAAVLGATGEAEGGIYELGGPEVKSFRELMEQMLEVIHRRRLILSLPRFAAWLVAFGFDMLQAASFQLIANKVLTRDQLRSLKSDNVVSEGAKGFSDLGISPVSLEAVLPDYLWKFRPSGQYDEMTNSARNLRNGA
ncbi:complex I NDUFA9 subunit family protein [Leisingera caerulea]|uniref:complex I NDUFA9 subunit family protein n=1 Tax=Leisingera caerulea TaxID=506591 RepID=UPI0021A303A7|nr:complex I NDUFA9 subunit family protein [Leisingera caerulea]UWQ49684.1 complex I NDUFA9 subunit family protein [Leisingera caerulea]UWQ83461.1 complex I NDUFA9 subunit family protein [Leisingera caerulea]